ncbi:hypothetical protein POM88_025837 [Heracleum sosnowskyi]|uniref:TF-B3 domain-containing protein n=1 Tax=Heracleum sosnowskyi TaxID=360622 RepID=A0AAD8I727_9APIA|nr:hypothetical protein POM88_025837 [Heracleum sosnowskyi]
MEGEDIDHGTTNLENSTGKHVSGAEMNEAELENIYVEEVAEMAIDDVQMVFSSIMTKCNINNTSHGEYIPGHIIPQNRKWISGEHVTFRNGDEVWEIGLVYSNGLARFSAGWNKFSREKKVKLNETVVFNLLESEGGLSFDIGFPG